MRLGRRGARSTDVIETTELLGDGIGPVLCGSVHAVADELPMNFRFHPADISLEAGELNARVLYDEACSLMHRTGLALK
ncbi:MAG: hypothetical protein L0Z68_09895 [Gammaproteobacteria bacterium]|nr:hypothetical protein [Gammaproteobacteria bacterium]